MLSRLRSSIKPVPFKSVSGVFHKHTHVTVHRLRSHSLIILRACLPWLRGDVELARAINLTGGGRMAVRRQAEFLIYLLRGTPMKLSRKWTAAANAVAPPIA
jgi:hypothetical protein